MFLPKNEATFSLDVIGDTTKQRFQGVFTIKPLLENVSAMSMAASIDKLGGNSISMPFDDRALIRATVELDLRVIDAPNWYKVSRGGRDLMDSNVVFAIYGKTMEEVNGFTQKLEEVAKVAEDSSKEEKK